MSKKWQIYEDVLGDKKKAVEIYFLVCTLLMSGIQTTCALFSLENKALPNVSISFFSPYLPIQPMKTTMPTSDFFNSIITQANWNYGIFLIAILLYYYLLTKQDNKLDRAKIPAITASFTSSSIFSNFLCIQSTVSSYTFDSYIHLFTFYMMSILSLLILAPNFEQTIDTLKRSLLTLPQVITLSQKIRILNKKVMKYSPKNLIAKLFIVVLISSQLLKIVKTYADVLLGIIFLLVFITMMFIILIYLTDSYEKSGFNAKLEMYIKPVSEQTETENRIDRKTAINMKDLFEFIFVLYIFDMAFK